MEWEIDCPKTNFTSYVKYYKIYFSTFIQVAFVDLKISYFTSKNGFIWEQ